MGDGLIKNIKMPTIIISGEKDITVPKNMTASKLYFIERKCFIEAIF